MRVSDDGKRLIQHFEGFAAEPYRCPAGYWTIGFGHVLSDAHHAPITEEEAQRLLDADVRRAEAAVTRLIKVRQNQHQFDALISFTFNLGAGALQRSTLRQVINRGDVQDVIQQFERWVWGGGRKLPGLVKRRAAEATLYTTPMSSAFS